MEAVCYFGQTFLELQNSRIPILLALQETNFFLATRWDILGTKYCFYSKIRFVSVWSVFQAELFSIVLISWLILRKPASTGRFFAQLQSFWSTLQTVEKRGYSFESSFQRSSTNIISTTEFRYSWHCPVVRTSKQSTKAEVFLWTTIRKKWNYLVRPS